MTSVNFMSTRNLSLICGLCFALFVAAMPTQARAGVIIAPVGAVIDAGGPGFGSIVETFNQSGLSAGYTSGVTNFNAYIGSGPTHTFVFAGFEWFSNSGTTGATVTYDLGSVMTIDALALWNEEISGIGTLDLLGSLDGTAFFSIATGLMPFDNPANSDYRAEVFSWGALGTRYVRFVITDSPQPNPGTFPAAAIGEVAFRTAVAVPEPGSMALFGLGGVGLVAGAIRRRRRAHTAV